MKKEIALIITALALCPGISFANESNYTYLEGNYVFAGDEDISGPASANQDYDGWGINGSLELVPNVFLRADYSELNADNNNAGDLNLLSAGIGGSLPLGTKTNPTDLYGVISYESIEQDRRGGFEADGFGVTGGARLQLHPAIEINPYVSYLDYGDIDGTNTSLNGYRLGIDGVFTVNELFAITAGYRTTKLDTDNPNGNLDLEDEFHVGARLYLSSVE